MDELNKKIEIEKKRGTQAYFNQNEKKFNFILWN